MEALARSVSEAEDQHALGRAKSQFERPVQIEKEHRPRRHGGGARDAQKLAEIATLRDGAALALTDFREVRVRWVAAAEPDSVGRLLRGSAGAGAGLLSLCIGAIPLWSRLFAA